MLFEQFVLKNKLKKKILRKKKNLLCDSDCQINKWAPCYLAFKKDILIDNYSIFNENEREINNALINQCFFLEECKFEKECTLGQ